MREIFCGNGSRTTFCLSRLLNQYRCYNGWCRRRPSFCLIFVVARTPQRRWSQVLRVCSWVGLALRLCFVGAAATHRRRRELKQLLKLGGGGTEQFPLFLFSCIALNYAAATWHQGVLGVCGGCACCLYFYFAIISCWYSTCWLYFYLTGRLLCNVCLGAFVRLL